MFFLRSDFKKSFRDLIFSFRYIVLPVHLKLFTVSCFCYTAIGFFFVVIPTQVFYNLYTFQLKTTDLCLEIVSIITKVMADNDKQPDLFEWKPKESFSNRFRNFLKSDGFFRFVCWLIFLPLILYSHLNLLRYIYDGSKIEWFTWDYVQLLLGSVTIFLVAYTIKKREAALNWLKSGYFWIVLLIFILFVWIHYRSVNFILLNFLVERWIFTLGILSAIFIFIYFKKPHWISNLVNSGFFWAAFAFYILAILIGFHDEILSLNAKFWLFPVGFFLVAATLFAVWKVPHLLTESIKTKSGGADVSEFELEEKRLKLLDDSRKTVATVIGGLFVIIGAVFTFSNYELSSEGQYTNRFSTAVVLLKDADVSVRLGGLYALERVAKDSPKDHKVIMEILAAYIRERSKAQKEEFEKKKIADTNKTQSDQTDQSNQPESNVNFADYEAVNSYRMHEKFEDVMPPADVQAAIEIISRRKQENDAKDFAFDFTGANLIKASLSNNHLPKLILDGANLKGANFADSQLNDVRAFNTNLSFTKFYRARLYSADFYGANLVGARFDEAELNWANFSNADLNFASFEFTDLSDARLKDSRSLTFEQLSEAIINENTTLPPDLESRRAELLELSKKNLLEKKETIYVE